MWRRLSSSWSSDPDVRVFAVIALVAVLTLPAVTTRLYAADEIEAFSFLRSLWFDRDVSFDNEYRHFADAGVADAGFRQTFLERSTDTGLRINFTTIGCALLWSPFYAAADAGVHVARALGSPVDADGYGRPYVAAVCYGSACYGWLAVALAFSICRTLLSRAGDSRPRPAALAAWAALLGTPLVFYMFVSPPFTHAASAFAVGAFVLAWLRVRDRWTVRGMVLLGALAALMAMVREQDGFLVIGPAIDIARAWLRQRDTRLFRVALACAGAFALTYAPQAAAYLALNGRLGPSRLVGRKMTWTAPHALGVVASPEHGWLLWTPLVVLAACGWVLMVTGRRGADEKAGAGDAPAGDVRWIGVCLLAMVLSQVYVSGSVESWTVAGAFGQRRFVGLTAPLAAGLAFLFASARTRGRRLVLTALVAAGIWWNVGLMVQFGAGWMDRQRLDLPQNAYNTFITVPRRLPEIAYRYLFERQRFYRTPPATPQDR